MAYNNQPDWKKEIKEEEDEIVTMEEMTELRNYISIGLASWARGDWFPAAEKVVLGGMGMGEKMVRVLNTISKIEKMLE